MEIGGKLGVDVLKIIFPVAAIWPEVRSNFVILYLYYWFLPCNTNNRSTIEFHADDMMMTYTAKKITPKQK